MQSLTLKMMPPGREGSSSNKIQQLEAYHEAALQDKRSPSPQRLLTAGLADYLSLATPCAQTTNRKSTIGWAATSTAPDEFQLDLLCKTLDSVLPLTVYHCPTGLDDAAYALNPSERRPRHPQTTPKRTLGHSKSLASQIRVKNIANLASTIERLLNRTKREVEHEFRSAEAVPARILRVNIRGYGSPETLDAWFEFVDESDFSRHGNPVWDLMKVCREAYVEVRRALPDRALVAVPKPKKKGFALAWLPVSLSRDQFCVRDVLTVAKYLFNSLEREGNDIAVVPPLHTIAVEPQLVVGGGGGSGPQGIALGDQIMYTAAFLGAQRVYLLRWEPYYKNQSPQSLSPLAMLDNIPNLGQHQPEAVRAHYSHLLQAADKAVEEEEEEEAWVMALW
ncbi:uncharacterized protein B0T15DRAFT_499757 [Chaetomium strumarium]|uniref:Uncharacterized protein n=1 Tax=Chaetomium strumarium TaxID=1170767 RepID=A0AAJ0M3N0_9PEZI|nr:hypothetical protein B0T15DRAFT_499757 [Chaetomium strumarium]